MNTESIGSRVMTALTGDQIAHLVDALLNVLDSKKTGKVLSGLDSDMRETLSRLLSSAPAPTPGEEIVSSRKNIERWNDLWSQWEGVVFEVGDEEGEYVHQDHHWEEPYFDGYALSEDLEKVAAKMLLLLEDIYTAGVEDDDLFVEAIVEIEKNIELYPDWMGATDCEGVFLESAATRCLLKWEWLVAGSSIAFLDRIIALEDRLNLTELKWNTFSDFFVDLPEKAQREIYDYMTANRDHPAWEKRLSSAHSTWYQVYHGFSKNFDHEDYLDGCRSMLKENWHYGLPVIEDLLKKEEDAEAERIITQTVASFLGHRAITEEWRPEDTLLIKFLCYGYGSPDEEIIHVLEKWIAVSQSLDRTERAFSLRLQLVTYQQPYKWDAVVKVYGEVNHPPFQEKANQLIGQWVEFLVINTLGLSFGGDKNPMDCWITWLLETGLNKAGDKEWFVQKVSKWLELFGQSRGTPLLEQQKSFFLLTSDLFEMYGYETQYPNLYEIVSMTYGNRQDTTSRQAWLRIMHGDRLVSLVTEFWQGKVEKFLPDPASVHKSDYRNHAEWLVAANELSTTIYDRIVARWKIDHGRRKNLWKAIEAKGLPV